MVANAATPETVDPASAMSTAPLITEVMNDQKWIHPRISGRRAACVGAYRAAVTSRGYVFVGYRTVGCAKPHNIGSAFDAAGPRVMWPAVGLWQAILRRGVYPNYERILVRQLAGAQRPRHVALILDGNRRWAREAGFDDVSHGHRAGARKIADLLGWCQESDVEVVTLWLLGTDNLAQRSASEIGPLLEIIADVVDELAEAGNPWRLRIVGALDLLPTEIADRLSEAGKRTEGRAGMEVNVAVGYGGRHEIAEAVRKLLQHHAKAGTSIEDLAEILDVEHIAEHLYTSGQPDPDLVIRTSGEQRLSGFLLWQSANSEFWFCEAYWPAFRKVDFLRALRDYAARHRRFGH